jgi:hypothetical protein
MELNSEIEINASSETVWNLLTDTSKFPEWNPFIRRLSGELKVGQKLVVFMQPSGTNGMEFKPDVVKVEPNHELRWLGHLIFPGLFDGEHIFQIESLGDKLLKKSLDTETRRGFNEMNQKLKERAESN